MLGALSISVYFSGEQKLVGFLALSIALAAIVFESVRHLVLLEKAIVLRHSKEREAVWQTILNNGPLCLKALCEMEMAGKPVLDVLLKLSDASFLEAYQGYLTTRRDEISRSMIGADPTTVPYTKDEKRLARIHALPSWKYLFHEPELPFLHTDFDFRNPVSSSS
jgi:hypothetical protein